MPATIRRTGFHEVAADGMPDDGKRILPLLGNDELKLCVDARGVMHDMEHVWPSHPPARITWSGRRYDRYNSNLFEWGFLDLRLAAEESLPAVTAWRQRLHPREGYVETEIARGAFVERTLTFVHLEKNLVVIRRAYEGLPDNVDRRLHAVYTLCQVGTEELPFRVSWTPGEPFPHGIAADTVADGMRLYRGRVALFADVTGDARAEANRLALDVTLPPDGAVTVCLALHDDLGDHPQLLDIPHAGWMTPPVREVHEEVQARLRAWRPAEYAAATDARLAELDEQGFDGLFGSHRRAWRRWFDQAEVTLPEEEEKLRAALETQLYTMRCSYTRWSSPANPFNTSWGAPYFWDERFPTEGLMRLGITDMPERTLEWRRDILPFSTMMSGGRGARYVPSAVEPGSQIGDRNATQYYEFFTIGVIVNYIYEYCRFRDEEAVWRRYYPVFRECAEFFRRYLLIELPGNNIMVTWLVDVNETYYPVQDGPFALCGAARILQVACKVADALGIEEAAAGEWRRLGGMTLDLATYLFGGRDPRRDPDVTTADDPVGPYMDYELADAPFPAPEVDASVRAWRDAYRHRAAPENQMTDGKTNITGEAVHMPFWSWGKLNAAHTAAMRERPEEALGDLREALTTLMDFAALNESAQYDLSEVHHPWFNTGAGAYVRALTRMLVYPRDDETILLPGVPAAWRDFAFTLPIFRGGTVRVEVAEGRLVRLEIRESKPGVRERRIHVPPRFLEPMPALAENVILETRTAEKVVLRVAVERTRTVVG